MSQRSGITPAYWLALVIGNTRLHWGYFCREKFLGSWHTPHLTEAIATQLQQSNFRLEGWQAVTAWAEGYTPFELDLLPTEDIASSSIWVASVVLDQSDLWRGPARLAQFVERSQIPLSGLYPTLGIDRAINLLGAGDLEGWPVLVIDAGTAITFTAGVDSAIYGGAILPGLKSQQEALAQKTAVLARFMPAMNALSLDSLSLDSLSLDSLDAEADAEAALPERWAGNTEGAIASGLTYGITATVIDYLQSWWQQFPTGKAVITGGDGPAIHHYLQQRTPEIASRVLLNSDLMFYGMRAYKKAFTNL